MSVQITIFWVGNDGILIDTAPTSEIAVGYGLVLDVISRLDGITPTRYELRSELGNVDTTDREGFIAQCIVAVVPLHRYTAMTLLVHPSDETYGLAALAEDPTGFFFEVDESRRVGDRMWELLQQLAREYRERGITIATSIAGPI